MLIRRREKREVADIIERKLRLTVQDLIQRFLLYQQPCTLLVPTSRQYGEPIGTAIDTLLAKNVIYVESK